MHQAVSPNPVSETDGRTILNDLEALETPIKTGLTNIVAKKPAFQALPVGGLVALVKQDIFDLKNNTDAFGAACLAACPVRFHFIPIVDTS
jgi:hypothetical protein